MIHQCPSGDSLLTVWGFFCVCARQLCRRVCRSSSNRSHDPYCSATSAALTATKPSSFWTGPMATHTATKIGGNTTGQSHRNRQRTHHRSNSNSSHRSTSSANPSSLCSLHSESSTSTCEPLPRSSSNPCQAAAQQYLPIRPIRQRLHKRHVPLRTRKRQERPPPTPPRQPRPGLCLQQPRTCPPPTPGRSQSCRAGTS